MAGDDSTIGGLVVFCFLVTKVTHVSHRCDYTGVYLLCENPLNLNTCDLFPFVYVCYILQLKISLKMFLLQNQLLHNSSLLHCYAVPTQERQWRSGGHVNQHGCKWQVWGELPGWPASWGEPSPSWIRAPNPTSCQWQKERRVMIFPGSNRRVSFSPSAFWHMRIQCTSTRVRHLGFESRLCPY